MCLEHKPHFRARLVTYLSLLVNNIVPPPGRRWADMIETDHRQLNSTCDPPTPPTARCLSCHYVTRYWVEVYRALLACVFFLPQGVEDPSWAFSGRMGRLDVVRSK